MNSFSQPEHSSTVIEATLRLCSRVRAGEDETEPWQRGIIATEVCLNKGNSPVIRIVSEISARCLEEIPPTLLPEDRFAGFVFRQYPIHPGVSDPDSWRRKAKHPEEFGYDRSWPLPSSARNVYEQWESMNCPVRPIPNQSRKQHSWLMQFGIANPHGRVGSHTMPDYGILLNTGLRGLRCRLADSMKNRSRKEQILFSAMDRILEGLQGCCRNSAALAKKQATHPSTPSRRQQLHDIARDCTFICDHPPQTLAQALQLLIFGNCADILNHSGDATSFGRLDQLLLPFYEKDLADGRLDRKEALQLIAAFLIKTWTFQTSRNICIGGLRPDGEDGTNAVSFLFLEAMETTRMPSDISVRVHSNTSSDFWEQTARVMRMGLGRADIYNDDITIPALTHHGVDLEDARDYAPLGCVEVMIPGRCSHRTMGFNLNLNKILELVLNRGTCLVTGKKVWNNLPRSFSSFEQLMQTYHQKVRTVIEAGIDIIREDEHLESEYDPQPWLTVLSRGGVEDGRDLTAGQPRYNPCGVTLQGVADIANSLYAVRHLLFDEKTVSLNQLRNILQADWKGYDVLHRRVIDRLPRFGQDSPELNRIVRQEAHFFADSFSDHRTCYNGFFWPMIFGVSSNMLFNAVPKTGATPGGRCLNEPLAHSLQPSTRGPRGSLSDILTACTAIDLRRFPGGISNVQECDPMIVSGDEGLKRLVSLLRGYVAAGGMELSLNFLSEEQLCDAQKNPEQYPHLWVRIFGLSARFVTLSPGLQQTILDRVRASAEAGH